MPCIGLACQWRNFYKCFQIDALHGPSMSVAEFRQMLPNRCSQTLTHLSGCKTRVTNRHCVVICGTYATSGHVIHSGFALYGPSMSVAEFIQMLPHRCLAWAWGLACQWRDFYKCCQIDASRLSHICLVARLASRTGTVWLYAVHMFTAHVIRSGFILLCTGAMSLGIE